ncbi:electron carrier [Pseudocyphellaria aurata]|nr:electron carrier [Pseudocyphellaria aurata]
MAPSVTLDLESDFFNPTPKSSSNVPLSQRTLLLSPPSLSSHPEKLNNILTLHDRSTTDIQMLDRLSLSLVSLPQSTYDMVLILLDADNTRTESKSLLTHDVLLQIVKALKPGGRLQSQDDKFAVQGSDERREGIFAGLIVDARGLLKPNHDPTQSVPLRFGNNKNKGGAAASTSAAGTGAVSLNLNGKRKNGPPGLAQLAGVGFVDFSDDSGSASESDGSDELIDEDTLLGDEDLSRPVIQPPSCRPAAGKRRRACKDCSCGLAQRLEAEDAAKRATADQNLAKLRADDLAEVDFTIQGKVGSCGNCALGDAFRCDGCPYIGLPPFKPGEEVRLLNEDVQL